jgi:hypothetical protein
MLKMLLTDVLELTSLAAFGAFVWSFAAAFPH